MKKRSVNERIEDGILMLSTTIDFIVKNNLERLHYIINPKDKASIYFSEHFFNYKCTREKYLELEKELLNTGKFCRDRKLTSDNDFIINLNIKEDRPASKNQRIALRHDLGYTGIGNPEILSISIDGGIGFEGNKIYGNQIINLKNQLP